MRSLTTILLVFVIFISCCNKTLGCTEVTKETSKNDTLIHKYLKYSNEELRLYSMPPKGNVMLARLFYKNMLKDYLMGNAYQLKIPAESVDKIAISIADTLSFYKNNKDIYLSGGSFKIPKDSYFKWMDNYTPKIETIFKVKDTGNPLINLLNFIRENIGVLRFDNNKCIVPAFNMIDSRTYQVTIDAFIYDGNTDPEESEKCDECDSYYYEYWYRTNI